MLLARTCPRLRQVVSLCISKTQTGHTRMFKMQQPRFPPTVERIVAVQLITTDKVTCFARFEISMRSKPKPVD